MLGEATNLTPIENYDAIATLKLGDKIEVWKAKETINYLREQN